MQCDIVSSDNKKIQRITQLLSAYSKPFNGLKAYATYIEEIDPEHWEYRNACFYDFVLHCNAFALREIEANPNAVEAARDYFTLAIQLFSDAKDICFTGLSSWKLGYPHEKKECLVPEDSDKMSADANESTDETSNTEFPHRVGTLLIPNTVEAGSLSLLSLTFSNWACAELTGKSPKLAFTLLGLLDYVSPCVDECPLLGYRMDIINHINASMCDIMRCNFTEAFNAFSALTQFLQEKSGELEEKVKSHRSVIADLSASEGSSSLLLAEGEAPPSGSFPTKLRNSISKGSREMRIAAKELDAVETERMSSQLKEDQKELGDIYLLHGFARVGMGIAQEYLNMEVAEAHYQEALGYFELAGIINDEKDTRSYFYMVVQKMKQKISGILATAAEPVAKEVIGISNKKEPKRKGKEAIRKKSSGKGQKFSEVGERQHYFPPPINSALRTYIREEGLPIVPGVLFSLQNAATVVSSFSACDYFVSPLSRYLEGPDYFVAAVLLPTETPLAWASDVAAFTSLRQRQSVWSPRVELPGHLKQCLSLREGQIKEKGFKLTVPIVKSLLPKPLPQVAIDTAAQSLNTALKLLSNRLVTLIKSEKAFEDRWVATERIKQALKSYYIPQVLMAWKAKRIEEGNFKIIQENHAARVLQRFFRLVLDVKPRLYGFKSATERREKEQHDAATILQKYARRFMARKEREYLEMLLAVRVRQITVIQSLWRRHSAQGLMEKLRSQRKAQVEETLDFMRQDYAATLIQSHYRRHLTQILLWSHQGHALKAIKHHFRLSRNYYATQIQKIIRGALTRKIYGQAVEARRYYGRNAYLSRIYNQASITIQRIFRGWRTRRTTKEAIRLCKQRMLNRKAAELAELKRQENENPVQNLAAVKIQSLVRMAHARKEVQIRRDHRQHELISRKGIMPAPFSLRDCEY